MPEYVWTVPIISELQDLIVEATVILSSIGVEDIPECCDSPKNMKNRWAHLVNDFLKIKEEVNWILEVLEEPPRKIVRRHASGTSDDDVAQV